MTQTGSGRFDGDPWELASSVGLMAPVDADDGPFGELIYISAELRTDLK